MITKKINEIHTRLNDVKGSERKILLFDSENIEIVSDAKNKETFKLNSYISINWICENKFITSEFDEALNIERFKMLMFGMKPKELKEIENGWRNTLIDSMSKKSKLYIAYYIGGNNEIVVSEVGKLTEKEFDAQIKFKK